jgi:hypothetical protein
VLTRPVLLAAFFVTLSPTQPTFDFEGRYWMPQMTARLRVEGAGFGTDIDAQRDLGMTNTNFPQGSFTFHSAGHQLLRFTYTPIEFTGDQSVTRSIVYRGTSYSFGTRIVSDLQVQHLQLAWAYQFSARDGLVKIGPMLEADGFLMSSRLQAPALTPAVDQRESLSAGLPAVGLALDLNPHPRVNIYGQVAGMKAGSYGYYVGSDAGVKLRAWKGLFFTAGYRTFNLHVTSAPDFARLDMRGPFVGTGWRF